MITYRLFLFAAAAVLAVALYFFGIGIADGSVSSFNIVLWLVVLVCLGSFVAGGYGLNTKGQRRPRCSRFSPFRDLARCRSWLTVIVFQPRWKRAWNRKFRPGSNSQVP
ncbi:hypothetical protein BH10PSE10_BH10PSE10_15160 [soil metagenome]